MKKEFKQITESQDKKTKATNMKKEKEDQKVDINENKNQNQNKNKNKMLNETEMSKDKLEDSKVDRKNSQVQKSSQTTESTTSDK